MPSLTAMPRSSEVHAQRGPQAPSNVVAAVRNASARTGVDFAYLMEKAAVESGFRTDVKAEGSSATGLYQFIDSTWLNTMKEHGARHGYQRYADAIQRRGDGTPFVADPDVRREILNLRKNPEVSALLAAEFARDNQQHLRQEVGGNIGSTELYMAHFLGPAGAAKFLNAMKQNPDQTGARLFPEAAAANRGIFYNSMTGKPNTLDQIYDRFAMKFDDDIGSAVTSDRTAAVSSNAVGGLAAYRKSAAGLAGQSLSMYTILALNALETPLDSDNERVRGRDGQRVRQETLDAQIDSGMAPNLGLAQGA